MEDKIINLLHMARKAGKLKSGYDACERSCFSNDAKLVIYASDIAERTKKHLLNLANAYNVKIVKYGFKTLFGSEFKTRDIGIICIEDANFAKGILQSIG
ncbi:MAG: ribosomal L7Ae/L30e/S12e/Gadd45 family protein [Candidatus Cloacimonetes bacterium]|jgi:ribosomal protein L7Ae-like RNA K-turn-binding protein|nr:ribosomal L7Ae/L30e/S12e/Gadd45 family protein [Candidatus Cloacimonadota bacterium]